MATFIPNKKNLRDRADYGVRVARPGYDANFCAQNQLLFNSGWPILQIAEVIDYENMPITEIYEYEVTVSYFNTVDYTGGVMSHTMEEVDAPPAGYDNDYEYEYTSESDYTDLEVNKKYVKKYISGTRHGYSYPAEQHQEGDLQITTTKTCTKSPVRRKAHRLGYTPFFVTSDGISGVSGYIVLFSLDITNDVDYPYTEKPLAMLNPATDYGIKSSSIFGKNVPGLCSDMFSKLVQAVKTEKTCADNSDGDKHSIWSPVRDISEAYDGMLLPFEFYSFLGNTGKNTGIDGGCYYHRGYPYYLARANGQRLEDAWAVAVDIFQSIIVNKNSLVVVRSPMVSPEYEERTV